MSHATNFLTVILVWIVAVKCDDTFELHMPVDYPKFEDNFYLKRLQNVKFPERKPSIHPIEHEYCESAFDNKMCCSVTSYMKPFTVKANNNGLKKWIVQSKYFEQYIKETKCKTYNEGRTGTCLADFNLASYGMRAVCETDKGTVTLLVGNGNGQLDLMPVTISIGCSCHLKPYYKERS